MNEHDEIAELLGAYALDAVDADEAAIVEAHLAGCPRCAAEVSDHREVAAMLAHSGAPAPEGLWTRIAASLEEPPPEMDIPLLAPSRTGGVVDLSEQRRRRTPRWVPGAAVAAALVVVALVTGLVVSDDDRADPTEQIAAPDLEAVARDVMNDPEATRVVLSSTEGDLEAPAAIGSDGSGYLMGNTLPALDDSLTYQLWGIKGDLVVSLGVLGPSPGVVAFHTDPTLDALAITQEVAGGVPSSANSAVLVGELS